VNVLAGNLVAAIPRREYVAASTANAAVMVSIATERKRQRQAQQLSGPFPESSLPRAGPSNADFKDLARHWPSALAMAGLVLIRLKLAKWRLLGFRN